jgi:hypothetical protein
LSKHSTESKGGAVVSRKGNVYHIVETPEVDEGSNDTPSEEETDGVQLTLEVQEIKRETKKMDLGERESIEMIRPVRANEISIGSVINSMRSNDNKFELSRLHLSDH